MWSLFSRDPAKDFAYEIGEKVPGLEDKSIWALHNGKKKGTGEPVSVFTFDVKGSSESQVQLAKASFKRMKTLRHPNILTFLDGVETDKVIYIATEPVVPLETHLQNNSSSTQQSQLAIAWGLHQIVKGLSFLVNDCNLIHNNVCMCSVFVDQAGEWILGGVDYVYATQGQDSMPPVKILPYLERYDPPEKSDLRRGIKGEKWSSDMWGLGCLIWEVFNGPLPRTSSLKSFAKIPKSLVPNYCELVGANPNSRPNPAKFIQDCRRKGGFMDNAFIKTMLFLEEIQIKEPQEKTAFFTSLTDTLDSFPQQFCKHKILPQLLTAYEFGNAGSSILAPLFKLGKLLDADEYQKKIVPCVIKLFSSADRTTRVKLLQQIELFVDYLQPQTVDQIFTNISTGFMDTNPMVRECTVKAMIHVAPKLNYKNLNEELMKHFARLQSKDDQGGIRTNTTVCLGKIASYLNPQMRQKILCSAFLRALKDPFPPARQAGIIGMAITQNLYTLNDVCNKLLPPLCMMTMDPEKMVRDQAFKAVRGFLQKLEKVSENPELQAEMEKDVLSGGTVSSGAAGWAGWAVTGMSSITSKIYSKATRGKPTSPGAQQKHIGELPTATSKAPATDVSMTTTTAPSVNNDVTQEEEVTEENEGWDDDEDWGDIDSVPSPPQTRQSYQQTYQEQTTVAEEQTTGNEGWDDEDWGSLEEPATSTRASSNTSSYKQSGALKLGGGGGKKQEEDWGWAEEEFSPVEDSSTQPASAYNWGQDDMDNDDFFSSVVSEVKKPKPSLKTSAQLKSSSSKSSPRASPARSAPRDSPSKSAGSHQRQAVPDPRGGTADDPGWGDGGGGWEDDGGWDSFTDTKETEAERKKREREEKRQQRQREMQEKREAKKGAGAMRLGVKKLAAD